MRDRPAQLAFLVALVAAAALPVSPAPAGWWDANWACRREVDLVGYKPSGLPGDDVAVVAMPTAGQMRPDGSDVRVATSRGLQTACRVLMVGPGDTVRVAFAVHAGETKYHVYLGNPKPPKLAMNLDIRRGVLLETWEFSGGGLRTLDQARDALFRRDKTFLGADFLDRIFIGHNPFGPQDRLARVFTAWLLCPREGEYTFVTSSMNSSFLLIDDKLVVDNGGWHRPQHDIRVKGKASLTAGLHKLVMYHVTGGGDPIIVAAWSPPGDSRVQVIPPAAFAPVARAKAGPLEYRGRDAGADFLYEHAGEAFVADRYYQRYVFRAMGVGRFGAAVRWEWDFGDGQKGAGQEVEHVFLTDGEHKVTLAAYTAAGQFGGCNRVGVARPWDRVARHEQDGVRSYAKIVAGYDFAALSPRAAAEAMVLLGRADNDEAVAKAGRAFCAARDIADAAAEEVMPIWTEAMRRLGKAREAADALAAMSGKVKSPAVAAGLLVRAGRVYLDDVNDASAAAGAFGKVVTKYAHLTTAPPIRAARLGIGDAYRASGDRAKAAAAYAEAGPGRRPAGVAESVARGNFARYVEDLTRRREFSEAAEKLEEWEDAFPADRIEGYSSLLRVRLLAAQENRVRAAREAETLVRVNPQSNYAPQLLLLASESYRSLKADDKAVALLRQIISSYPESTIAAEAAKRLGGG